MQDENNSERNEEQSTVSQMVGTQPREGTSRQDTEPIISNDAEGTATHDAQPSTSVDGQASTSHHGQPSSSHDADLGCSEWDGSVEYLDSSAVADEEVRRILENFDHEMAEEAQYDIMHGFDFD